VVRRKPSSHGSEDFGMHERFQLIFAFVFAGGDGWIDANKE
jgi:hypothetical protein